MHGHHIYHCQFIPEAPFPVYECGFVGFLRMDEITVPGSKVIQLDDLSFTVQEGNAFSAAELALRWYKHNRCGTPFYLRLPVISDPAICPVNGLLIYLQQRSHNPGPIFLFTNGSAVSRHGLTISWTKQYVSVGLTLPGIRDTVFALEQPRELQQTVGLMHK